ncbi:DUF6298 domain-containing protein [Botryobacter ruber]|uniref:DUF6298 domain-containing protein n=1 Tax=Botryobacter ruber TaxID=2171629 RepID=UPI000E0BA45B|nr:DUF6298 domain-containing protein [Botryobacter ruber]
MRLLRAFCFAALATIATAEASFAQLKTTPDSPLQQSQDGTFTYKAAANGDRIPDYSYCGYKNSEAPIPDVPVKVIVPAMSGDATATIQRAIDYVASLPLNPQGFRGAVLLEKGTFELSGGLIIRTSGVVLRGSGPDSTGTVLIGTGQDRETLIRIAGAANLKQEAPVQLADTYFPVNSTKLTFKNKHPFKVGDQVIVNRPSTQEWIEKLGTDKIGTYVNYHLTHWEPGDFDQNWYRQVVAVTPESITLDIPLTTSLDPQYGGGQVARYSWSGRISHVGVENLRCVSSYAKSNPKDENHRWMAVTLDNVQDAWVRRLVAEHFVSSAVAVWETASRVTVEDCKSLAPVGETGNFRRYAFHTLGQQVLFQRCYAEYAYHAFSVGFTTPGPNAFVQCYSYLPLHFSGAIGGWASGVLFDKVTVDGGIISLAYRDVDAQGGGWSAANSLIWQCRAAQIHVPAPPTAQNWAFANWAQGYGNGHHESPHTFVKPESFFYAQLEARTGKKSPETAKILTYETDRTTAPTPELTAQLSERSKTPDLTMEEWIDLMMEKYPIQSDLSGAKKIDQIKLKASPKVAHKASPVSIKNGWIVQGNQVLTGRKNRTSLWRGSTRPSALANPAPNLVRFVPGRTGRGLTDNLDTLVHDMLQNNVVAMRHFPALWYERRRDDHARTRRADADVWAPFYEQPFSRSGQGEAFDRLSKYDLTKWNTWYWLRLKKFADLADQHGLLFIQEHYLQHNIIEEGAHWTDYPWRTANNINNTGFAENPAYAGDKRIYMAEAFYDTTHTVRNKLHRAYIRKSLDNFKGNTNILHHLGMEYTGPLHFVQFWLDVIAEWEKENQQDVLVMLPGTKEMQDAILADPKRARLVDAIDVIQWHYRQDGSLYAPAGGVSLAERQYARIHDVGETSFGQIYRAVQEFRTRYPEKAIVYSRRGPAFADWAVFMAGGSLASLPEIRDKAFFEAAAAMDPLPLKSPEAKQYGLGKKGTSYIIFSESPNVQVDLTGDKQSYRLKFIHPETGEIMDTKKKVQGGKISSLEAPYEGPVVVWLR